MKRYAFIESNTTGTGRLAIERLLGRGHHVSFFTRAPAKYPFLTGGHPGLRLVEVETDAVEPTLAAVQAEHRASPFTAVLGFSTYFIETVASVARALGLPGLSPRAARLCHHKAQAREVLRAKGLACPPFWVVRGPAELEAVLSEVKYPLVVKPPADSGSVGVARVDDAFQLRARVEALAARTQNDRGQPLDGSVLLEGYLQGAELSVEVLTSEAGRHHVLGITQKHLGREPHFVELGHDFPAALPEGTAHAVRTAVCAALDAVGFDFGFSHTELRLAPQGPTVIEINPRLAGGMIPELVRFATGLEPLQLMLDQLEGRPLALEPRHARHASIRFIVADREGTLERLDGVAAARALPGVEAVVFDKAPGLAVRPPENSNHRLGHVIASGESAAAVEGALSQAMALLKLVVR